MSKDVVAQKKIVRQTFSHTMIRFFRRLPIKILEAAFRKTIDEIELQSLLKTTTGNKELTLRLSDEFSQDFYLRDTHADKGVVRQIFLERDYEINRFQQGRDARSFCERLVEQGKTPLIVDAGANIGASVVWFSNSCPSARVIGIEPAKSNIAYARKNTEKISDDRIRLIQAALSDVGGNFVQLNDPSGEEWMYSTFASEGKTLSGRSLESVRTVDIQQLVCDNSDAFPYLLKIDIEGAEEGLFDTHQDYISQFCIIIIELHDYLYPQARTSKSFLRFLSQFDYDVVLAGENVMCFKDINLLDNVGKESAMMASLLL